MWFWKSSADTKLLNAGVAACAESNKGRCSPALNATLFNGIFASRSVTDNARARWRNANLLLLVEHIPACRTGAGKTNSVSPFGRDHVVTTDAANEVPLLGAVDMGGVS